VCGALRLQEVDREEVVQAYAHAFGRGIGKPRQCSTRSVVGDRVRQRFVQIGRRDQSIENGSGIRFRDPRDSRRRFYERAYGDVADEKAFVVRESKGGIHAEEGLEQPVQHARRGRVERGRTEGGAERYEPCADRELRERLPYGDGLSLNRRRSQGEEPTEEALGLRGGPDLHGVEVSPVRLEPTRCGVKQS